MQKNNTTRSFAWTAYYMEFADKLLKYKHNRKSLLTLLKNAFDELNMRYPFIDNGEAIDDICPFTVFASFNKGITNENRIQLMERIGSKLNVTSIVPTQFDGIPVVNNMRAWFFGYKVERQINDIDNLWDMFEAAIDYADHPSETTKQSFITCYDNVSKQHGIKWNLTMGLYWIRPFSYLNLDERNRSYLLHKNNPYHQQVSNVTNLKQLPNAETYLKLIAICQQIFKRKNNDHHSFPELSYDAWRVTTTSDRPNINGTTLNREKKYWLYAPGRQSSKWDEFYSEGIMGIGWDEMGDLSQYPSKEAMRNRMKELYGAEFSYRNSAHATWQFANDLQPGDIVYAKKGLHKIVGRGVITSEYIYDTSRNEYRHIRKVNWTHIGEWDHPGQAAMKTLTDITPYTDYVQKLKNIVIDKNSVDTDVDIDEEEKEIIYESYSEKDFLNEVFMDEKDYNTLVNLLKKKKNIILQGPPGVGKTFAAKRLAYSIIGEKDSSRVMMVQFHQSYSYEDFIMGFRPSSDGFELTPGPFYQFCKKAYDDDERAYFFIIDEINRGNLSKIFGELLMLIESDKRGERLRLLYSNEQFSVPSNVYIIGMMNTADRSLALIDYALRRRFAFFDMEPGFDSEGFKAIMDEAAHPKFNALIEQVKHLNDYISKDESLGDGFRIGHSYFCTDSEITDEWLVSVVNYEILPLLAEYWFDEQSKVEHWTKKLCGVLND